MTLNQKLLLSFLKIPPKGELPWGDLNAEEKAAFYVDLTFLESAIRFMQDEQWLLSKQTDFSEQYQNFLQNIFSSNLLSLQYLQEPLGQLDAKQLKSLVKSAEEQEQSFIFHIQNSPVDEQKRFMARALSLMVQVFQYEHVLLQGGNSRARSLAFSLYRTFDGLDQIFGLDYSADVGMKTDLTINERLYEGAGLGVQSSYSTLLTALREINPSEGCRFIDLGSGYGRVGLVIGFLRPDIDFVGYEYVQHRVDISNTSTAKFGLESNVHFYTQDLAEKSFKIPEAEVYYLYDPFSKETYLHVLNQLIEFSRHRRIVIVTKGNARLWLQEVAEREAWPPGREFDLGNLAIFTSR
ncbi:SAM-dependent methyltransferase [Bdellovibrio sp.]|uniref:SAM-dependent methyltransferase n=1 Tax=Bdellovibrio TaxID=958 RepID=UPI003222064E